MMPIKTRFKIFFTPPANQAGERVGMASYLFLLLMRCFEMGLNKLTYPKYIMVFFGFSSIMSNDLGSAFWAAFWFGFVSLVLGFIWYFFDWERKNVEVGNKFNDFVKEMRDAITPKK